MQNRITFGNILKTLKPYTINTEKRSVLYYNSKGLSKHFKVIRNRNTRLFIETDI